LHLEEGGKSGVGNDDGHFAAGHGIEVSFGERTHPAVIRHDLFAPGVQRVGEAQPLQQGVRLLPLIAIEIKIDLLKQRRISGRCVSNRWQRILCRHNWCGERRTSHGEHQRGGGKRPPDSCYLPQRLHALLLTHSRAY
jgi:hypothetical protein